MTERRSRLIRAIDAFDEIQEMQLLVKMAWEALEAKIDGTEKTNLLIRLYLESSKDKFEELEDSLANLQRLMRSEQ